MLQKGGSGKRRREGGIRGCHELLTPTYSGEILLSGEIFLSGKETTHERRWQGCLWDVGRGAGSSVEETGKSFRPQGVMGKLWGPWLRSCQGCTHSIIA